MSDWLTNFIFYLGAGLLVIGTFSIIVFSAVWRKRTSSSVKSASKTVSKVFGSGVKSGKDWYLKRQNKKPVLDNNQLPGGIGYGNKFQPVNILPQKIPKQGGSIPIPTTTVVEMVDCPYELVYMRETCGGYELGDEYNGRSIAFKCVGGYDKKTGKLKIWIYDYHYHKDSRKEKSY